jgi:hypothetical protein
MGRKKQPTQLGFELRCSCLTCTGPDHGDSGLATSVLLGFTTAKDLSDGIRNVLAAVSLKSFGGHGGG